MKLIRSWPMHNLVAHPLAEIVYWTMFLLTNKSVAKKAFNVIHDGTLPNQGA